MSEAKAIFGSGGLRQRPLFLCTSLISKHFDMQSGGEVQSVGAGQFAKPRRFFPELFAGSGLRHEPHD